MDEEDSADTMRKKRAVSRLRDIKDLEKDKDGKAYSYSTLAEAINEHTKTWLEGDFRDDTDLSKHHISSYLGSRKSKKGEKSSLPKGLRLEVIERFILDCTEIGKLYNNKLVSRS
ncbi:hypothetical protein [Nitrosomonas ureae]|uniref:Uncharacterized protein n=1 Tax=Nitrosomonas ureae TaxID=44577 RepID=A0A1H9ALE2_9PROT|nr:hypothetical protein [Nitrosomonas ureae]SEP76748.1 hypothetical protein SAMN05421510_10041 [Nitrosomonas ureae]